MVVQMDAGGRAVRTNHQPERAQARNGIQKVRGSNPLSSTTDLNTKEALRSHPEGLLISARTAARIIDHEARWLSALPAEANVHPRSPLKAVT
jgi:hypothetical protein